MAVSFVLPQVGYLSSSSNRWSCARAAASNDDEEFEARLARISRKVGRPGKKAELRKAKRSESLSSKKVLLPPVPLEDPVSDGLVVELGFNSYTERLNGRFASLGLAAVLLVELASGGSFIKYHEPSVLGIQAYTMLALAALFIKLEREKISVWPPPAGGNEQQQQQQQQQQQLKDGETQDKSAAPAASSTSSSS